MGRGTMSVLVAKLAVAAGLLVGCGSTPEPSTTAQPPTEPAATQGPATETEATPEPVAPGEEPESTLALTATAMAERLAAEGKVTLREIAFQTGTAELLPAAHPQLAQVVVVLREQPAMRLRIQVHSDAQGSGEFNQRITDQRALAIKEWLVAQGIDVARLEAAGYGEQQPIAPNTSAEGRAANRRVELVVVP